MGFWIFMFIMEIVQPLTFIGFGYWFIKSPPAQINGIFGYRTKMSMKNIETWHFAHRYCGRQWIRTGWITMAVSVSVMLLLIGQNEDRIGAVGGTVVFIQIAVLAIFPVLRTERELRRQFHTDGSWKGQQNL